MPANKYSSQTVVVICLLLLTAVGPLAAATTSESDRLEKLERAVEQLQKRNAELETEVSGLKAKQTAVVPEGKMKTKIISGGKTYVEKVVEEKLPLYVQQRGPELKLVLGGFELFRDGSNLALTADHADVSPGRYQRPGHPRCSPPVCRTDARGDKSGWRLCNAATFALTGKV